MSIEVDVRPASLPAVRGGITDYLELTKFRLVSLVLFSTGVGFVVGWPGLFDADFALGLTHTILGTALVACGSMVFNQVMERDVDARMPRTCRRPLPEGRVGVAEAAVFGTILCVLGLVHLAIFVNVLTAGLAALTVFTYVALYTPLKMVTTLCTLVGAVSGAIPPMMGFTAAAGELTVDAWVLFGILFTWQIPHFLAIAWLYRDDYARGGQKMLPVVDPSGAATSRQIVSFSLALLLVSLMPTVTGMTAGAYFSMALLLGLGFIVFALLLSVSRDRRSARQLFLASVIYLPVLLGMMVVDRA